MNEIDQIHAKLDKQAEKQEQIMVVLTDMRGDLNYHIRRTDILEKTTEQQRLELQPVRRHVEVVNALTKFFAAAVAAAASIAAVIRLIIS
jgi:hypothetical protein